MFLTVHANTSRLTRMRGPAVGAAFVLLSALLATAAPTARAAETGTSRRRHARRG